MEMCIFITRQEEKHVEFSYFGLLHIQNGLSYCSLWCVFVCLHAVKGCHCLFSLKKPSKQNKIALQQCMSFTRDNNNTKQNKTKRTPALLVYPKGKSREMGPYKNDFQKAQLASNLYHQMTASKISFSEAFPSLHNPPIRIQECWGFSS